MSEGTKLQALLIATLGSEPQVVTAALDLLLNAGEPITHAIVIHTVAPGTLISAAIERLADDFNTAYKEKKIFLKLEPILGESGIPLPDVETEAAAQAAFRTLYRQVHQAKLQGYKVHLSIAGGRKTLAVYGMATAQLLFDEKDHLWHLFSAGEFLEEKRLHPLHGDQVHLVEIPFIPWSQVSPILTNLQDTSDPYEAADRVRRLQLAEKIATARAFILGSLTAAERKVVQLLVEEGLSDIEIADRLVLSPRTVEQHLRSAYIKAATHWELESVNRTNLVALLSLYYSFKVTGNPA